MKRALFILWGMLVMTTNLLAQDIPQHISYTRVYDFIDEIANDGFIEINSAVKPYSRKLITQKLAEATRSIKKMSKRQVQELEFFLKDYRLERYKLPNYEISLSRDNKNSLDLFPLQYSYKGKLFRTRIRPILGMHILKTDSGNISKRWFGAEIQMMLGRGFSIYGSLRDISFSEQVSKPNYLLNMPGYEYKEPADFSDSRGGIKYAWKWGSLGLIKDNVVWGDNYNGANILSGRAPSFPMITLRVRPTKWFEMNYIHGWLVSNVIDSTKYYLENDVKIWYRNTNKFLAANIFTFTPYPRLNISFGNAIVYAENNVQPAYLLPVAFYKSIDHSLTKGIGTENQNSSLFFNISSRNIKHLHLFSSLYFDEIKFSRFSSSSMEKNPMSIKVGGRLSNYPIRDFSVTAEFTKTNIITYEHSIEAISWKSNGYGLGHYLGDNAQELYFSFQYKPIRGLDLQLDITNAQHGNEYEMMKYDANGSNKNPQTSARYIRDIIGRPSLGDVIWKSQTIGLKVTYEIFQNAYAIVKIENSTVAGEEAKLVKIPGEVRMTPQQVLDYYSPSFLHGEHTNITVGFSLGF